jgi:hypothetical protein
MLVEAEEMNVFGGYNKLKILQLHLHNFPMGTRHFNAANILPVQISLAAVFAR